MLPVPNLRQKVQIRKTTHKPRVAVKLIRRHTAKRTAKRTDNLTKTCMLPGVPNRLYTALFKRKEYSTMQTKLQFGLKQAMINFKTAATGFALALSAAFVVMPQAQAAQDRWLKLKKDPSSTEYMMLDRKSIKADKKTPQLKNASFYVNNFLPKEQVLRSIKVDISLHCVDKTFSVRKATVFSKPDLKGEKMEEREIPENNNPLDLEVDIDKVIYQTICK